MLACWFFSLKPGHTSKGTWKQETFCPIVDKKTLICVSQAFAAAKQTLYATALRLHQVMDKLLKYHCKTARGELGLLGFGSSFDLYSPVGTGEQATGRVDVPSVEHDQIEAAASAAAATCSARSTCVNYEVLTGHQILGRSLTGRTVTLQIQRTHSWAQIEWLIDAKVGLPIGSFYVTSGGRIVCQGNLCLQPGDCVQVVEKLLGGARPQQVFIPGQWTCTSCGIEGCWPSRFRCFRCTAPKPVGADSSQPVLGKGQPRQGRAPVNLTFRPPRRPPTPTVNLEDASTIAQVFSMLSGLGVSHAMVQQIKSSIPPPSTSKSKTVGREKRLQIIAGKINMQTQQVAKLDKNAGALCFRIGCMSCSTC